jgi:hypothetical protein
MKKTNKNTTLNDLALQMDGLASQMPGGFKQVNENHEFLVRMVSQEFDAVDVRLGALEYSQEEIRIRLDNAAYRFELVEVQNRVTVLEKKVGIKHR